MGQNVVDSGVFDGIPCTMQITRVISVPNYVWVTLMTFQMSYSLALRGNSVITVVSLHPCFITSYFGILLTARSAGGTLEVTELRTPWMAFFCAYFFLWLNLSFLLLIQLSSNIQSDLVQQNFGYILVYKNSNYIVLALVAQTKAPKNLYLSSLDTCKAHIIVQYSMFNYMPLTVYISVYFLF